jgi:hypothetical protein
MGDSPGENASIEDFLGESGGASADEDPVNERADPDELSDSDGTEERADDDPDEQSDSDDTEEQADEDSNGSTGETGERVLPDERGQTTAQITPAGRTCESCETTAMRLWHDDGQFVCCSCKQWE